MRDKCECGNEIEYNPFMHYDEDGDALCSGDTHVVCSKCQKEYNPCFLCGRLKDWGGFYCQECSEE